MILKMTRRIKMTNEEFIKEVFEIAFGDGAKCTEHPSWLFPREFTKEEAIEQLKVHSYNALRWEEIDECR